MCRQTLRVARGTARAGLRVLGSALAHEHGADWIVRVGLLE
jgi:hypothetical protein